MAIGWPSWKTAVAGAMGVPLPPASIKPNDPASGQPLGYRASNNPKDIAENQRGLITQTGDRLLDEQRAREAQYGNQSGQTKDWLNSYLQPMVEGTSGGYNPEEASGIQNSGDLSQYELSQQDAEGNFLSPEEQAQMRGDPNYSQNFDPDQMSQDQTVSAAGQRGAVGNLKSGLRGSINPDALRQSGKFQQDSENQLGANQGQFGTTLGAMGSNVRGAIDPNAVNPSSEFLSDYNLSPEEQQDIVTGAGISAGAGYRASEGSTDRAARAAGASPMGVAAYRARSERDAASAGGDAMTQARIAASAEAAKREMQGEQLRENAGQFLTNTKTGTELAMGKEALAGTQALGQQALGQRNTAEGQRLASEQYLTGANLNAETTGGEAELANEANLNTQGRQVGQFNATTGAEIAQVEDTARTGRAAGIAQNRQTTGVNNQNTRYGQGLTRTNMGSGQAKTVADARVAQQNAAIGNYTGQQQQASANQQAEAGRQVSTYGTQAGATNQAGSLALGATQVPTTFDKSMGALQGVMKSMADGGVATEPTTALLGEEGPEMVVKINDRYRARSQRPQPMMQSRIPRSRPYGERMSA